MIFEGLHLRRVAISGKNEYFPRYKMSQFVKEFAAMKNPFWITPLVLLSIAMPAFSADDDSKAKEELEAKVRSLEKRVRQLEQSLEQRPMQRRQRDDGVGRMQLEEMMGRMQREMQRQFSGGNVGEDPFAGGPENPFAGTDLIPGNKPRLGVQLAPVSDELAKRFNNAVKDGAFVMSVVPGSPAEKAGINVGDSISAFNGKAVASPQALIEAVKAAPKGKSDVTLSRRGESLALKIDLAEALDEMPTDFRQPGVREEGGWLRRGPDVRGNAPAARSQTEVKASALEMNEALIKELKLTDEQRTKMSEVLTKHSKALNEDVATRGNETGRGRRGGLTFSLNADVNKLVERHAMEAEKELSGVLNDSQIKSWADYRKRNSSVSVHHSAVFEGGVLRQQPDVDADGAGF